MYRLPELVNHPTHMSVPPSFILALFLSLGAIALSQSPSASPVTTAVPSSQPVAANDPTTDQSVTLPGNASEPAVLPPPSNQSALQWVSLNTRKPALGMFDVEAVFTENHLTPEYNSCTWDTPTNSNSTDCVVDNEYNDRIMFDMEMQFEHEYFRRFLAAKSPIIETQTSASSIATPTISDVSVNGEKRSMVTVFYNCRSDANGFIALRMSIYFSDNERDTLQVIWHKKCSNGQNDRISSGYLTGDFSKGTQDLQDFGQDTAALLKVSPSDVTTEFFLKLDSTGSYQEFSPPYLTSSDTDTVSLSIRGNHPRGGVLEGLQVSTFQVVYDCHRQGEATIEANVGIPPFNNVSAMWKKGIFYFTFLLQSSPLFLRPLHLTSFLWQSRFSKNSFSLTFPIFLSFVS